AQSSSVGFSTSAHPWRYGFPFPSASSTRRYDVFQIGASTTYPTRTVRFPSPAKWSDTAFFWLSWERASTSNARRNSASTTGLENRSCWTSDSLTARSPSAHHRLSTGTSTAASLPAGACCVSTPTTLPVSFPGWLAAVGERVTSTGWPWACWTMAANDGLPSRLMANEASVRLIGSRLS